MRVRHRSRHAGGGLQAPAPPRAEPVGFLVPPASPFSATMSAARPDRPFPSAASARLRKLTARPIAGSCRSASASSWSRQPRAAKSMMVRSRNGKSWTTAACQRSSFICAVIHGTMSVTSNTSRSSTAPGSPLSRSDRVSMVKDRLNPEIADHSGSPMRASVAASGFRVGRLILRCFQAHATSPK
jgi:hypothetical protein